jgi:para-aminobenzoate synthetase component I
MPSALPSAVWRSGPRWLAAPAASARLLARDAAALTALPAQLADSLGPDQLAVGVIRYQAGLALAGLDTGLVPGTPLAEVQLVSRHDLIEASSVAALAPDSPDFQLRSPLRSELSQRDYADALLRIEHYLRAGDCYQVNFARRFSGHWQGDVWTAFARLAEHHAAPHGGFFRLANGDAVFGVSPERFLQIRDGVVITEPIKGSRPRGATDEQDYQLGESLLHSDKDRAENLMIVDLLRNDLGRVCEPGSVLAEPLFELRRFSNVQHLVSTIRGTLRPGVLPLSALLQCFPGGSITGAPKKRAMEIIAELEPVPRDYYCGSQFVLDAEGNLDSSILIRTFQSQGDVLLCHGGGGIVIDSDPAQEFEESLFKVQKLMESLL